MMGESTPFVVSGALHDPDGGRADERDHPEAAQSVALECHSRLILEELSAMVDEEGSDYYSSSSSDSEDSDSNDDEDRTGEEDTGGDGRAARRWKDERDRVDADVLNREFSYHEAEAAPPVSASAGPPGSSSSSNHLVMNPFGSADISVQSIMDSTPAGEQSLVRRRDASVVERTILRSGGRSGLFRSRSDAVFARGSRDRVAGYAGGSTILGRVIRSASGRALSMSRVPGGAAGGSYPSADNMGGSGRRRTGEHRVEKNADSWGIAPTVPPSGGANSIGAPGPSALAAQQAAPDLKRPSCPNKAGTVGRALLRGGSSVSGSGSDHHGGGSRRGSSGTAGVGGPIIHRRGSSYRRSSGGSRGGPASAAGSAASSRRGSLESLLDTLRRGSSCDSEHSSGSNLLLDTAPINGMAFLRLMNDRPQPQVQPPAAAAAGTEGKIESPCDDAVPVSPPPPARPVSPSQVTSEAPKLSSSPGRRSSFKFGDKERGESEKAGSLRSSSFEETTWTTLSGGGPEARFGGSRVIIEEEDSE